MWHCFDAGSNRILVPKRVFAAFFRRLRTPNPQRREGSFDTAVPSGVRPNAFRGRGLTLPEIVEQSLLMIFKEASECLRLMKNSHFVLDNGPGRTWKPLRSVSQTNSKGHSQVVKGVTVKKFRGGGTPQNPKFRANHKGSPCEHLEI